MPDQTWANFVGLLLFDGIRQQSSIRNGLASVVEYNPTSSGLPNRPYYANVVDPDPNQTSEQDYQQRLQKDADYHQLLEERRNDVGERKTELTKDLAAKAATINQLRPNKTSRLEVDLDRVQKHRRIELSASRDALIIAQSAHRQELAIARAAHQRELEQSATIAPARVAEADKQSSVMASRLAEGTTVSLPRLPWTEGWKQPRQASADSSTHFHRKTTRSPSPVPTDRPSDHQPSPHTSPLSPD